MSIEHFLIRRRRQGCALRPVQVEARIRGVLAIAEVRCEVRRRLVLTATFRRLDGGTPVPDLQDVVIRAEGGGKRTLSGVEAVPDGPLHDVHLFAQSWYLEPAPIVDLEVAEGRITRLARRLHALGVDVHIRPDGLMMIAGEFPSDNELGSR